MNYILQIHEDSFAYLPSYSVSSEQPFPPMAVGHLYEPEPNSGNQIGAHLDKKRRFRIKDVSHSLVDVNGTAIHAITRVLLEQTE